LTLNLRTRLGISTEQSGSTSPPTPFSAIKNDLHLRFYFFLRNYSFLIHVFATSSLKKVPNLYYFSINFVIKKILKFNHKINKNLIKYCESCDNNNKHYACSKIINITYKYNLHTCVKILKKDNIKYYFNKLFGDRVSIRKPFSEELSPISLP
jgi:hypothetical protein